MTRDDVAGAGSLLRLALRRDRLMIAAVLAVVAVTVYGSVVAAVDLYSSPADLVAVNTATNANVGAVAMYGTVHDLAGPGLAVGKLRTICVFILVFLVIALVRRHTRADEETGRIELLAATVTGRAAPLAASLALAAGVSLTTGAVTAVASGAGGWEWGGSLALGASVAAAGLAFAGFTAAAMQVFASTSACSGLVYGLFVGTFLLRTIADVARAEWLLWLSPFGWIQLARALDGTRWWPLLVPVVAAVVSVALAVWLLGRRDLGAGLVSPRPGAARGRLGSPAGLVARLTRGATLGWLAGLVAVGILMGGLLPTVGDFLTGAAADFLRRMGGAGDAVDLYLIVVGATSALAVSGFGLSAVLRARSEETAGHLELVLATPVTRLRSLAPHLAAAFGGTALLLGVFALAVAGTHTAATGEAGRFGTDVSAILVQLPAVWALVGVAVALLGWLPRATAAASWALLAACALVGEVAPLLGLPGWVSDLSPFAHVPRVPAEPMAWGPVLALVAVAAVAVAVGLVGYRRRDLG